MRASEMTEVLEFPLDRTRPAKRRKSNEQAEVLIFPGIRIERGEFSLSDRLPTETRKPSKSSQRGSAARNKRR